MTTLPRNLPRSGRMAWIVACNLAEESATRWRIVHGSAPAIHQWLGHDRRSSTDRAISMCIKHGVLRRVGKLKSRRAIILVDVSRAISRESTENTEKGYCVCGEECSRKWCPDCLQNTGRPDRAWMSSAVRMAVDQHANQGRVDPYAIHMKLGVPLWRSTSDNEETRGKSPGVVPFLLSRGLFFNAADSEKWREALVAATGISAHTLDVITTQRGR